MLERVWLVRTYLFTLAFGDFEYHRVSARMEFGVAHDFTPYWPTTLQSI